MLGPCVRRRHYTAHAIQSTLNQCVTAAALLPPPPPPLPAPSNDWRVKAGTASTSSRAALPRTPLRRRRATAPQHTSPRPTRTYCTTATATATTGGVARPGGVWWRWLPEVARRLGSSKRVLVGTLRLPLPGERFHYYPSVVATHTRENNDTQHTPAQNHTCSHHCVRFSAAWRSSTIESPCSSIIAEGEIYRRRATSSDSWAVKRGSGGGSGGDGDRTVGAAAATGQRRGSSEAADCSKQVGP